jgi:tripeptide aminopeptidase
MFKTDYKSILSTQSTTGDTADMMAEINRQLDEIKGVTRETDDYGNLYVTKGETDKYPAFVCHTDTVHKIHKYFTVQETELNYLFAYSESEGFQQVGIGGDDKCGIIACLELLTRLKTVKCVFFLDEEQGCKGSSAGNLAFFDDCRYAIQIDRKGGGDIITKGSGTQLCSPEFEEFIKTLGAAYNYVPTTGATTDVVKLKDRGLGISCCNLSAGYYNPHTKQEYIDADELSNCIEFCVAISRIKTTYPHVLPKPTPKTYSSPPSTYVTSGRKCAVCSTALSYNHGVICNPCVVKHLSLKLIDGEPVITQESVDRCDGCGGGLFSAEEVSCKYCAECQFCGECGVTLTTTQELRFATCERCLWSEVGNVEVCETRNCTNILQSQTERRNGYCKECCQFFDLTECTLNDCGRTLLTESEQINGICSSCMSQFH